MSDDKPFLVPKLYYIYIKFIEPIGSFGKTEAPPAYADLFPNKKSVKIQIEKTREKYGPVPSSAVAVPLTLCDIIHKSCRFNVASQLL